MTIYLDENYVCHMTEGTGRTAVQTDFFNGMCYGYIEGMRYIPKGHTWTDSKGNVYSGEMCHPVKDYRELMSMQNAYEQAQAESTEEIAGLMDEIESLCDELIGGF